MTHSPLPSLETLNHRLAEQRLIRRMIFGPESTPQLEHLANGFVRRVDQAIVEYELARQALTSDAGSEIQAHYRAEYHLETCISALRRAMRFLATMHKRKAQIGSLPVVDPEHELLPRTSSAKRIVKVRDALEHMDERVCRADVLPTDFTWAKIGRDSIRVHDREELREITYGELADWLKHLYDVASQMGAMSITIGTPPRAWAKRRSFLLAPYLADGALE
jgi:hypothetical protein